MDPPVSITVLGLHMNATTSGFFCMDSGDQTQVLLTAQQAFDSLSYLFSPKEVLWEYSLPYFHRFSIVLWIESKPTYSYSKGLETDLGTNTRTYRVRVCKDIGREKWVPELLLEAVFEDPRTTARHSFTLGPLFLESSLVLFSAFTLPECARPRPDI